MEKVDFSCMEVGMTAGYFIDGLNGWKETGVKPAP